MYRSCKLKELKPCKPLTANVPKKYLKYRNIYSKRILKRKYRCLEKLLKSNYLLDDNFIIVSGKYERY